MKKLEKEANGKELRIWLIQFCITISFLMWNMTGFSQTNSSQTWTADNGNGTFTNPIFYEEFSDPDLIRVGDDYYMTGTTMHTMPGLPVLHSRDLVNWELLSYAVDRLEAGPAIHLKDGKEFYGQGIWAPCFRYHKGVFYIFSNINRYGTMIFYANDPRGPWKQKKMKAALHDVTVLFDDDGKIYGVYGYDEVKMVQLTDDLLDVVPGSEKVIVPAGSGAGEGSHIYKIEGKYYITNTNYDPICYQVCLRADEPYGPYEVNVMSARENFGEGQRMRIWNTNQGPPFPITTYPENYVGCIPMHQGGIVQIQSGEWWGWSMLDYNSIGRVTALSPVTWEDGWPYFGLPGNLTRSPRTWPKPNTGFESDPKAPFDRNDNFDGPELNNIWQWNHYPNDKKWSLKSRKGHLRLNSLPAPSFWLAKNTLTQRGIGPGSYATAKMDFSGLKNGDIAGLALLNLPYAWIGIRKYDNKNYLQLFDQQTGDSVSLDVDQHSIWLRVNCNFESDTGQFSYSLDGKIFKDLGGKILMPYQLKTFQGVRYALFNFNALDKNGGYVDFDSFEVNETYKYNPPPTGQVIVLRNLADSTILTNWKNFLRPVSRYSPLANDNKTHFKVVDKGKGRVALQSISSGGFVTVTGKGGLAEVRITKEEDGLRSQFQWQDMLNGEIMLMSLQTNRYLFVDPNAGSLCSADSRGARPDHKSGTCFTWESLDQ